MYPYVILDVFTDTKLEGNQLAVFPDAATIPEQSLQPIAREFNLSETVFVYPPTDGTDARVRIFTPAHELPFAGHPTLGTATLIAHQSGAREIRLATGMGVVPVRFADDGLGTMSQPVPTWQPFDRPDELFAALGVPGSQLPVDAYDNGRINVYVVLPDEAAVAAVAPDFAALARLSGVSGINVLAGSGTRWKTRHFAPADGVNEDPATGSAAGPLGVHLARHGRVPFGTRIELSQG